MGIELPDGLANVLETQIAFKSSNDEDPSTLMSGGVGEKEEEKPTVYGMIKDKRKVGFF